MNPQGEFDWSKYNTARQGRRPRPLTTQVAALTGPGAGRIAVDLGAGSGADAAALAAAGWTTHAIDQDSTCAELLPQVLPGGDLVDFQQADLTAVAAGEVARPWPMADLIIANYAVPFVGDALLPALLDLIVTSMNPGGWCALNLFGPRDSFADGDEAAVVSEAQAREFFADLTVHSWVEEAELGKSFSGPHFWHNYFVIAQKPA